MREEFDRRRAIVVEDLNRLPGFSCIRPTGAFYAFPNIGKTGFKAKDLACRLLDEADQGRWPSFPIRERNACRPSPPVCPGCGAYSISQLPVIPTYPKQATLRFRPSPSCAIILSPRGPIEPGRASQTPEVGSPADRAGGNDANRESRMPRGSIETSGPAMAGLIWMGRQTIGRSEAVWRDKRFQQ